MRYQSVYSNCNWACPVESSVIRRRQLLEIAGLEIFDWGDIRRRNSILAFRKNAGVSSLEKVIYIRPRYVSIRRDSLCQVSCTLLFSISVTLFSAYLPWIIYIRACHWKHIAVVVESFESASCSSHVRLQVHWEDLQTSKYIKCQLIWLWLWSPGTKAIAKSSLMMRRNKTKIDTSVVSSRSRWSCFSGCCTRMYSVYKQKCQPMLNIDLNLPRRYEHHNRYDGSTCYCKLLQLQ